MIKKFISLLSLSALALAGFILLPQHIQIAYATPTVVTVDAYADTFIKKSTGDVNYSSSLLLEGSRYKLGSDGEQKVAILGFDLTQYPGKHITDAVLKFEVSELDSSTFDSYGIKSKAIKIYPEVDFANITFNNFLAKKIARPDLNPQDDYGVGSDIPSANPTLLSYAYPYINTFILYPTNGNTALESEYRAKVDTTSGAKIVSVSLGDSLKDLGGAKFSVHLNNQRGRDIKIYSKENANRQTPQLVLTLEDKPAALDTSELSLVTAEVCSEQGYTSNALTGLNDWRGTSFNPNYAPEPDVYERFYWKDLEIAQDDYSGIENKIGTLIQNLEPGQKFSFRIRAMDTVLQVPSYISSYSGATQSCSGATVPNWNDAYFIERSEKLLLEVANYITQNNYQDRIGWIEIGFTGKWGETNGACTESITQANLERYVDMYSDNFTFARLLSMTDDYRIAAIALAKPANDRGVMGLRRDSLGGDSQRFAETAVNFESFHLIKDRWKVAPFTAEFGGSAININNSMWDLSLLELKQFNVTSVSNGNTVTGQSNKNPFYYPALLREQSIFNEIGAKSGFEFSLAEWGIPGTINANEPISFYTKWLNTGNSPAYEKYTATLVLKNTSSSASYEFPLSVDFQEILPTTERISGAVLPKEYVDTIILPESGTYTAYIKATDANTNSLWPRKPMQLCNAAQQVDNSYLLGEVIVTSTAEPLGETPVTSTAEAIRINFEKGTTSTPTGYLKDSGSLYGLRSNGHTYGWSRKNTSQARERNSSNSPDKKHDTFNHMMLSGNRSWNIEVPNGDYQVSITAGDPDYFDSVYKIAAEGQAVVNGIPSASNRFVSGTSTITVTDGKLTLTNMSGAVNNKIDFIEIVSL